MIFTLVAIVRETFAMFYHDVRLQGALISVFVRAKIAFEIVFLFHNVDLFWTTCKMPLGSTRSLTVDWLFTRKKGKWCHVSLTDEVQCQIHKGAEQVPFCQLTALSTILKIASNDMKWKPWLKISCKKCKFMSLLMCSLRKCRKRERGMDLLLSVINDLVTHNLYNLSTITFCFYLHQFSAKFIFMSGS